MKKLEYEILFIILFMTVGIAAVSSNLLINGSTQLASNPDDFSVYFSDVLVNGTQDLSLVENATSLVFTGEFSAVGDTKEITYDVTNASMNYDADIDITCTESTGYLTISNSFDTDSYLSSRSTRSGVLTITLSKSYTGADLTQDISCTISASAVERNSQGSGTIAEPLNPYYIGREISIGTEKFNIISTSDDVVTMLAQYNLGTDYIQSTTDNVVTFSDRTGWIVDPGPKEIDIQTWSTNPKTYVNEYVTYLKGETGDTALSGDLITVTELGNLGCTITSDYSNETDDPDQVLSCNDSIYSDWLINGQEWWTKSAVSHNSVYFVWGVGSTGNIMNNRVLSQDVGTTTLSAGSNGIRPVITISKEVAEQLINVYPVGEEISIGDEKFNVISDNGTTVTMLAQNNISDSAPYKQTSTQISTAFSGGYGWQYIPGPKEIDVQTWGGDVKTILNNYVTYLYIDQGVDATVDLITLSELEGLGCTAPTDYSSFLADGTCVNSEHKDWLFNDQYWWTRSADSYYSDVIWLLSDDGNMICGSYYEQYGVRPVVTISKDILENLG